MSETGENARWGAPPGARSSSEALKALQEVYNENEALYQQSSAFIEQIYGQGELSMGKRNALLYLFRFGPHTVPQLARAKHVSRQYMLGLIHQLVADGYVEFTENADHKRSHLVQFTEQGKQHMLTMLQREVAIVKDMVIDIPVEQLQATAETLKTIREWQKIELGRILAALSATKG